MSFAQELEKRRTFAIISHPDAGKTTLTEKLLLFGGAIQTAGAVKSNKIKKTATSDFMEIEKQRGISVATSVMTFDYSGKKINILDTPGHKDFAEDTYRTLTAVDSVILVIDCVKGVEEQTERLMEVCRMRDTPVIVFINKLDREGQDPFDLLDELEEKLNIKVRPITWPVNMGATFKGVYHLHDKQMNFFSPNKTKVEEDIVKLNLEDKESLIKSLGDTDANHLINEVELIEGVYDAFDRQEYLDGKVAPVLFGSAVNNFGIKELLDTYVKFSPAPIARSTDTRVVLPTEKDFTGFVFKIHANIDPRHRDRIAFLRICSGTFERGKFYKHVRLDKKVRFSNPYMFFADNKEVVEEGYPGDVVGLYDTGNFKIGDTLTEGEEMFYTGIPSFSPELFREVINTDPMKTKQLEKGVQQLAEEGVAQLFTMQPGNRKIIGTVGELQFEVIQYRLLNEYGASCMFESKAFSKACWITSTDEDKLDEFIRLKGSYIAYDKDENPVFLAETDWLLRMNQENNPEITFHNTSEFKLGA